ncbi:hypothetical protein BC830DRAFT_36820 [Chytriomyces sp. MP71]|nr:hypothetical protein BC830DRAFT_36820 [Chytriomyces sp. MP71]
MWARFSCESVLEAQQPKRDATQSPPPILLHEQEFIRKFLMRGVSISIIWPQARISTQSQMTNLPSALPSASAGVTMIPPMLFTLITLISHRTQQKTFSFRVDKNTSTKERKEQPTTPLHADIVIIAPGGAPNATARKNLPLNFITLSMYLRISGYAFATEAKARHRSRQKLRSLRAHRASRVALLTPYPATLLYDGECPSGFPRYQHWCVAEWVGLTCHVWDSESELCLG